MALMSGMRSCQQLLGRGRASSSSSSVVPAAGCHRSSSSSSSSACCAPTTTTTSASTSGRGHSTRYQRSAVATLAYAPSLNAPSGAEAATTTAAAAVAAAPSLSPPASCDPMAAGWASAEWVPGQLMTIASPEQFDALTSANSDRLVVLMCKSRACRPCKMFTRRYLSLAARFPEVACCEVYGDATPETRRMMMQLDVRVTPTFRLYRGGECVGVTTGTNATKLMRAVLDHLEPGELANHAAEIEETMDSDGDEQQQQQQQQQ